jgi:hypothetical protein
MHRGYIKLWRKIRDNPRLKDPDYLALWIWILIESTHSPDDQILGKERITCMPGQFTTGRKQLSSLSGISESKVERLLNLMESEQQIEQRKTSVNRLITVINWKDYQSSEQRNEQQVNNDRTTSEQQVNTLKEHKNKKNIRIKLSDEEFITSLKADPLNAEVDFDREFQKMDRWLANNPDRRKTQRFIKGWIDRADRVVTTGTFTKKDDPWQVPAI